ncbi:hypothetical protein K7H08_11825 [Halomonas sp. IOP_6]|uniref:hypothetical protein n=1 Tax=Halomonas sp. IOP_6 TaxID=2876583 RepID=UPI001E6351C0|nr:hypothetical protein [Halomonas sp. IOP_6]MCD6005526.1 hypothetical protein [Halomonas sp. IOP_6]
MPDTIQQPASPWIPAQDMREWRTWGETSVSGGCQLPQHRSRMHHTAMPEQPTTPSFPSNPPHHHARVTHRTVIPEWGYRESILTFAR